MLQSLVSKERHWRTGHSMLASLALALATEAVVDSVAEEGAAGAAVAVEAENGGDTKVICQIEQIWHTVTSISNSYGTYASLNVIWPRPHVIPHISQQNLRKSAWDTHAIDKKG